MDIDLYNLTDAELQELHRKLKSESRRRNKLRDSLPEEPVLHNPGGRVRYWSIYLLACKHHKWYVGVTAQKVQNRYEQHASGVGAKWTKIHPPIGIAETYSIGRMSESEAVKIETEKTMAVMAMYGSDNVRGGSLVVTDPARLERTYQKLLRIQQRARTGFKDA